MSLKNISNNGRRPEILAPAGSMESLYAAVNAGCDAVYMGGSMFGARAYADNPDSDSLLYAIDYCHLHNVKLYLTVNTLLKEEEIMDKLYNYMLPYYKAGLDAAIVQDTGVIYMLRQWFPGLALHASTQMALVTGSGVSMLKDYGVTRIVPARELSLSELQQMRHDTDAEIEVFVHGALCYCYSGQCLFSSMLGGRSGNRGRCAQPCRLPYSTDFNGKRQDSYILSMKELCTLPYINKLIETGVNSFKIEGRLKDSFYIRNTVLHYRKLLDKIIENHKDKGYKKVSSGKIFSDFTPNPIKSFNRDFCEYFLDGRKALNKERIFNFDTPNSKGEFLGCVKKAEKDYFLLDRNDVKISSQDGLCYIGENGSITGFLVNNFKDGKIFPNVQQNLKPEVKIYKNKDSAFYGVLKNSKTKRRIGVEFIVKDGILEAIDEDKNLVLVEFSGENAKNLEKAREAWVSALQKTGESDFYSENIKFETEEVYFLPISKLNELRRNALEKLMQKRLENYKPERQDRIKTAQYPEKSGFS